MASEVGSDVIRSPICGVKEQKLLVHFCSQWPPSWCFIESHFHMLNDLQRPPMASEDKHHVIRPPHLCGQGTKVISALLFPEATFMVFLNSFPGRTRRPLAIHRPAWDAGKNRHCCVSDVLCHLFQQRQRLENDQFCCLF